MWGSFDVAIKRKRERERLNGSLATIFQKKVLKAAAVTGRHR